MKLLRKIAHLLLFWVQGLPLYRVLGRWIASSILVREATKNDQFLVQRWFNPNSSPTQGENQDSTVTQWVAVAHGQVAGFVELVRHPPEHFPYVGYWLFSLNIKPRWQGLGIGEKLSETVIDRAAAEGSPVLDLLVFEDNIRAIRLYRKLGFEIYSIPELEKQLESEHMSTGRRRVMMRKRIAVHL